MRIEKAARMMTKLIHLKQSGCFTIDPTRVGGQQFKVDVGVHTCIVVQVYTRVRLWPPVKVAHAIATDRLRRVSPLSLVCGSGGSAGAALGWRPPRPPRSLANSEPEFGVRSAMIWPNQTWTLFFLSLSPSHLTLTPC